MSTPGMATKNPIKPIQPALMPWVSDGTSHVPEAAPAEIQHEIGEPERPTETWSPRGPIIAVAVLLQHALPGIEETH